MGDVPDSSFTAKTCPYCHQTMEGKLQRIMDHCKAEVSLEVNSHTAAYETVEQYLSYPPDFYDPEDAKRCIEADAIVEIQAYPDTPVGCFHILAPTLDEALDRMLKALVVDSE